MHIYKIRIKPTYKRFDLCNRNCNKEFLKIKNTQNLIKIQPTRKKKKKNTYDLPPLRIGKAPEKKRVSRNVVNTKP